jgi:hypothetical protein
MEPHPRVARYTTDERDGLSLARTAGTVDADRGLTFDLHKETSNGKGSIQALPESFSGFGLGRNRFAENGLLD